MSLILVPFSACNEFLWKVGSIFAIVPEGLQRFAGYFLGLRIVLPLQGEIVS
jgi:hypothetical protein